MNANQAIAHALTASLNLLRRYTQDLAPQEYLHRPTPKTNCAAWIIGHLTLSDRSALKRFGVTDLPPLPDGFEKRFGREGDAPFCSDFGDVTSLVSLFAQSREKLIETVKNAAPQKLDEPVEKPHPMFATLGEVANFMALHAVMHAGQITLIRRSLGRPPLV